MANVSRLGRRVLSIRYVPAPSRLLPQCSQIHTQPARRALPVGIEYSVADAMSKAFGIQPRQPDKEEDVSRAIEEQKQRGDANLFDAAEKAIEAESADVSGRKKSKKVHTQHKYSTAFFKMSHRKLNLLGRQIAGKPIDAAILQMVFSEKRASTRIKSMLCVARDHAEAYKHLNRSKLIVAEAWVSKGEKIRRLDIKGRGRSGVKHHPKAKLTVVLKEGKTLQEKVLAERAYKVNKIRSPGLMRENKPIRNPGPMWAW